MFQFRPLRWIGEAPSTLAVPGQVPELLICRGSKDSYGGFFVTNAREFPYGFRLIARSSDGHEHELKVKTGSRLTRHQAHLLAGGIASISGHSVRIVKRQVLNDGTLQELDWTPETRFASPASIAKLVSAGTPLLGGVVVGLLRVSASAAALVGTLMWLALTAVVFISDRHSKRSELSYLYWLTTAVTFAASYAVVFLITANVLRTR